MNTIKQAEMKEKHLKISQENEKLLETKLQYRNLIKEINAWAVPLVRYSGSFLKWTMHWYNNEKIIWKTQKKTDYSEQKQYRQQKH